MNIQVVACIEVLAAVLALVEETVGEVDVLDVLDKDALLQADLAAEAAAVGPSPVVVQGIGPHGGGV